MTKKHLSDAKGEAYGVQGFGKRLRQRREHVGLRKQDLAAGVGVSLTTIQQYENGQMPKGGYAVRLARLLRCTVDWLLSGDGEEDAHTRMPDNEHLVMVPMVQARLSAGQGSFETQADCLRHYAFRWDFLHRKGNPAAMVLVRVTGNSMEPSICHNDVVLIDQSQTAPLPGRIYAVGVEDMVYLKIVDAMPGKLVLSSVNVEYSPIEVSTSEQLVDLVRIIGRAVWVGRELD